MERKRYNKFLKTLPKLAINPGPKIIFNSALKPFRVCKFKYILDIPLITYKRLRGARYTYLLINEHFMYKEPRLEDSRRFGEFVDIHVDDSKLLQYKSMRSQYLERLSY